MPPMLTVTAWRRWIDGMCSFYQSRCGYNLCGMLRLKARFGANLMNAQGFVNIS